MTASDGAAGEGFGHSLSVLGNAAFIGSYMDCIDDLTDTLVLHVFQYIANLRRLGGGGVFY